MRDETKQDALKRLAYIEGHIQGVRRMVDDEKYCVEILRQTHAVRRAIEKLEGRILDGHLHTCAIEGIKDGRSEEVIGELLELYEQANK